LERQIENIERIKETISLLTNGTSDEIVEVRMLGTSKNVISGYYSDRSKLVRDVASCKERAEGIYITLNPVKPDLLARSSNRLKPYAKNTTGKADITARKWLYVDLDAVRPSGISSTDQEKLRALELAKKISEFLGEKGFPDCLLADSGNGYHMLYRIDLPNDEESTTVVKRFLETLDYLFSDENVKVDKSTHDPNRLVRLYGTRTCKGDNTKDRPHRISKLLEVPKKKETLSIEKLQSIISLYPLRSKETSSTSFYPVSETYRNFDIEKFIAENGLKVKSTKQWNGADMFVLEQCPFDESHNRGEARILRFGSGALSFGCFHDSCSRYEWKDLKSLYGGYVHTNNIHNGYGESRVGEPELIELAKKTIEEVIESIEDDPGVLHEPNCLDSLLTLQKYAPADYQRCREKIKAKKRGVIRDLDRSLNRRKTESSAHFGADPNPYFIEDDSIYMKIYAKEVETKKRLTNFSSRIVEQISYDEGDMDNKTLLKIEGKHCTGRKLSETYVESEKYSAMNWVTEKWGAEAIIYAGSGTKDHTRVAIQTLSGEYIAWKKVYGHTGFRSIEGKMHYLASNGALTSDGYTRDVSIELDDKLSEYRVSDREDIDKGDISDVFDLLNLAPKEIVYPLVSVAFRAPLNAISKADYFLWIVGPTGSQKTELTAIFQRFFGRGFDSRNLPGNWSCTANELEKRAFLAKDALFVIDDFSPSGTFYDIQRYHGSAERILRSQGNLAGRGRMKVDGSSHREYYPRGIIVSSGEDIPSGESIRARGLVLELNRGKVDLEKLSEAQRKAKRGNYESIMSSYIIWFISRFDFFKEKLPSRQHHVRTITRTMNDYHDRIPDIISSMSSGFESFLMFALDKKAIDENEAEYYWGDFWNVMIEIARKQKKHITSENQVKIFIDILHAALISGEAHICDVKSERMPRDYWHICGWRNLEDVFDTQYDIGKFKAMGKKIGWIDEKTKIIYLEPETTYRIVKEISNRQGYPLSVGKDTLWKRMEEMGCLAVKQKDRLKVRVNVMGMRKYAIAINLSIFENLDSDIGAPRNKESNTVENIPELGRIGPDGSIDWKSDESGSAN